jgi:SPP1 gp7 family putative phage head morphogenesis protein
MKIHNAMKRKGSRLLRADPTRTTLIRRQFQIEMRRRFNEMKRDVFGFIFTLDALGLRAQFASGPGAASRLSGLLGMPIARNEAASDAITILAAPQPREFQFRTDSDKIKAFQDWLKEQVRLRILAPSKDGDPGQPWTARFIISAYKKGRVNAFAKSKQKQALEDKGFFDKAQIDFMKTAFGQPETTKKIQLLATRSFAELEGITDAMAQKLNRVLANGMVEGLGARDIAKQMVAEIDGITNQRALVLARTEVIHAHAEGQLDSFTDLGVAEVGVEAEWSTAGDDRVCPECEDMEGKSFPIEEAHGMIPLHPNCRCTWIPMIPAGLLK